MGLAIENIIFSSVILFRTLNLVDLLLLGRAFTWSNKREVPYFAKLNHFLVSDDWEAVFPLTSQDDLLAPISDHVPLLLDSRVTSSSPSVFQTRRGIFEPG